MTSCSLFLFFFSLYNLICCNFFYHYMVNKDEYKMQANNIIK